MSLVVGADIADAIGEGQRLNQPVRWITGGAPVSALLTVEPEGVVVEAVKMAEDGTGDVVVRLYESLGRRTRATVETSFDSSTVAHTDLLERPLDDEPLESTSRRIDLELRPFEIVTLRYRHPNAS